MWPSSATTRPLAAPLSCQARSPTVVEDGEATGITSFLLNGGELAKAQKVANHGSPRTTELYNRTEDEVTLDEIERIRI